MALTILLTFSAVSPAQAQGTEEKPITAPTPHPDQDIEKLFAPQKPKKGEEPKKPVDLSKIDPIIYVVDADNGRVVVMQGIDGVGYTSLGMPGYGMGRFLRPKQIWIDYARRMYVADSGNNRVIRIDQKSESGWSEVGGFSEPHGVAVDGSGVYVADTNNNRVVILDDLVDEAKPREVLTHPKLRKPTQLWIDKDGILYICCGDDPPGGYIVKTWMDEDEPTLRRWKFYDGELLSGSRFLPTSLITDESGIRILDVSGQRMVNIKNIKGLRAKEWRFREDPRYRLRRPGGLAMDHRGFLFIADSGNDRILKLNQKGEVVGQFFILQGDPATMLANPTSIFIHSPAPPPPPPKSEDDEEDEDDG